MVIGILGSDLRSGTRMQVCKLNKKTRKRETDFRIHGPISQLVPFVFSLPISVTTSKPPINIVR